MAYLPSFDFDVFVSYSHGAVENQPTAPLRDWTRNLVSKLETHIKSCDPDFDTLAIWCDNQFNPTMHLTDELRDTVSKSAILMIVMSPRYLQSSWCKDELNWFKQQVEGREAAKGKVFVIRAIRTDEQKWPDFLRDDRGHALPGFWFHDKTDKEALPPFGFWGAVENSEAYGKAMDSLQRWLVIRLRELHDAPVIQIKQAMPAPLAKPAAQRRIFLHARPECAAVCDEVKRTLTQDGMAPFSSVADPGSDMADWPRQSRARIEAAKHCHALALVRAPKEDDGRFIGDVFEIGCDERERIQIARGTPLPCAVLDRSGEKLPIDISGCGIERFDLGQDNWRTKFLGWLNENQLQPAAAS